MRWRTPRARRAARRLLPTIFCALAAIHIYMAFVLIWALR